MTFQQTNDVGFLPTALDRVSGTARAPRAATPGANSRARIAPADARQSLLLERAARPRSRGASSKAGVLSALEFQRFVERERDLADRGTRRFSVLVLRLRTDGDRERRVLAELARETSDRLRSTDLVGRTDVDRVEVLLTDTEPAGARIVARWIEAIEAQLGIALDEAIHVYPEVTERDLERPSAAALQGARTLDRWPAGRVGGANSRADSIPAPQASARGESQAAEPEAGVRDEQPANTERPEPVARAQRWTLQDLWPLVGDPTPLWKRALDVVVSAVGLVLLLPLFALVAIAIRIDSPGPLIFRQLRAGRGARPFEFYKFRSMVADAEAQRAALADRNEQDGPVFKIRDDPRITRVGRWLRRSSIDELPQLWNVLKGDISLVGPRSATIDEVRGYERWQRRRLRVNGGITCTWQVSGRSQIPFREWMRLDARYVAQRNPWLDLRLLASTLPAVISGRGAS